MGSVDTKDLHSRFNNGLIRGRLSVAGPSRLHPAPTSDQKEPGIVGLPMTSVRASAMWVALAPLLAVGGAAQAQYSPPRPSEPVVRMGPPMAIEDADDPDIYAPPPPTPYLSLRLAPPVPGQAAPGHS